MTIDNIIDYKGSFFKEQSVGYLLALGVMVLSIIISIIMIYYLFQKTLQIIQEDLKDSTAKYIMKLGYICIMIVGFVFVISFGVHSLITVPKNNVGARYLEIVQESVDFSAEKGEVTVLALKDDPDVPTGFKYMGKYFEVKGDTIIELTEDELNGIVDEE